MIKFESVTAKNFMSVGANPITIHFNKAPTTLVTGKNGNGKSGAVIEPLVFGLFGKSFRGIVKNNLVNSVNQRHCVVEVKFSVGPDQYKIVRGIKPSIFQIYKNGKLEDSDAASRDQQKYLENHILRTTYNSFCQVVILGSAAYTPFMQLKASQRREVIETLLGINVFSGMNKLLKEEVGSWKSQIQEVKSSIDSLERSVGMQKGFIKKLSTSKTEQDSKKKAELIEYKKIIDTLTKDIEDKTKTLDGLNKETTVDADSLIKDKSRLSSEVYSLQSDIRRYKNDIDFFNDTDICNVCDQPITEDHKNKHVTDLTDKLKETESKISELSADMDPMAEATQQAQKQEKKINDLSNTIDMTKDKLKQTKDSAMKIARSMKEELQESSASIEEENEKLENLKEELQKNSKELRELLGMKKTYELSLSLLKDSGIKSAIIKQYLPILNTQVNKYLQTMNFNVKFELDENFKESLQSRYRDEFTYGNFSMGERTRLDLALLFAWRDVARMKNSVNCNIIIMGEVFDSSLGQGGLEGLMLILNGMSTETAAYVISHRGGIEDKFRDHIRFAKVNGFTEIEQT